MSNVLNFDTQLFEKDDLVEDIAIDIDGIDLASEASAKDMVDNISRFYYDEEFMQAHPDVKKRIDVELESLRILIKMRKADESAHDVIVKAISANNSNASLYRAMTEMQKTIVTITTKINEIVTGLNNMLKGFQLELNFDEHKNDVEDTDEEDSTNRKNAHRGSKEFINLMLSQSNEIEDSSEEE